MDMIEEWRSTSCDDKMYIGLKEEKGITNNKDGEIAETEGTGGRKVGERRRIISLRKMFEH